MSLKRERGIIDCRKGNPIYQERHVSGMNKQDIENRKDTLPTVCDAYCKFSCGGSTQRQAEVIRDHVERIV